MLYLAVRVFSGAVSSTGFWIGAVPILLHAADRLMETLRPIENSRLRRLMEESPQAPVSHLGRNDVHFEAVKVYFDFPKHCQFVISVLCFNMISIFAFEIECTHSWYTIRIPLFLCIVALGVILFRFVFLLYNGRFHPAEARPRATRRWERIAISSFVVVLGSQVVLRAIPTFCPASGCAH